MKVDLPEDLQKIRSMLLDRIAKFNLRSNPSPAPSGNTIQQIVIGYEFEQAGWVCVVFDTRSDAELDGEWTGVIVETQLEFKHWGEAFWNADDEPFQIVFPHGELKSSEDIECEDFSIALGEALRDLVTELAATGAFNSLPLSSNCTYAIEDFNGYFGWLSDEDADGDED